MHDGLENQNHNPIGWKPKAALFWWWKHESCYYWLYYTVHLTGYRKTDILVLLAENLKQPRSYWKYGGKNQNPTLKKAISESVKFRSRQRWRMTKQGWVGIFWIPCCLVLPYHCPHRYLIRLLFSVILLAENLKQLCSDWQQVILKA